MSDSAIKWESTVLRVYTKTFADAAASYAEHGGETRHLAKVVNEIGDVQLDQIVPFDVSQLALRLFPSCSNSTRNRMVITPIGAVLNHAHERGWGPVVRLRRFKVDRPAPKKAASRMWTHTFMRQCDKDRLPHLAALVLFMAQTGARVSEALRLKWPEVDLRGRTALLLKVKNGANSTRYLTDELVARLGDLRRESNPDAPVFRYTNRHSVNERILAVCRRAEIPYKSSHTCGRHAMANNALALGVDIKSTMIAGGWTTTALFLETYVNPRNSGRLVADKFNAYQYDSDLD